MKNNLFLLTVALGWLCTPTMAQTAQYTDPSAALEVDSTSKGFLPPRLTTEERDAIPAPPMGLIIYNTSTNLLEYYDGTVWGGVGGTPTITVTKTSISFLAVKTSSQTLVIGDTVTWENQYNQGGGFDDASDTFIVPVAGTYFFFVDAIMSTINTDTQLMFYVNDSPSGYTIIGSNNPNTSEKAYGLMIKFLDAGDVVYIKAPLSSTIYGDPSNYGSRFGGFLLSQDEE